MQITQRLKRIALLVAIQYLALATAAPYLPRHLSDDACTDVQCVAHRSAIRAAATSHGSICPSCEWQKVARSAPPTPLAWEQIVRLVALFAPLSSEDPSPPVFGLPSSRAP